MNGTLHSRRLLPLGLLVLLLATGWTPAPQDGGGTEDPSAIQITQLHTFMVVAEGRLVVEEYILISNLGDETYVGREDPETGRRLTLAFTLPAGASDLQVAGPGLAERFVERDGGFADTEPIPPGMATVEVRFSYWLPYREGLQVERAYPVPVSSVVLLLVEGGMTLAGEGVSPAGTLDTQMGPVLSYTSGPLQAGGALAFTLVEHPQMPAPSAPAPTAGPARSGTREAAIGLLALAGAVVAVYLLWRPAEAEPLPSRARPLVESIAALDADYEAGRVTEKTYRQRRKSLKRQVRALLEGQE